MTRSNVELPVSHDVTPSLRLYVEAGKTRTFTVIHLIRHRNGLDITSFGLSSDDLIALRDSINDFLAELKCREDKIRSER